MSEPFRLQPAAPVAAYQSYAIRQPADVTVKAACEDVDCPNWAHGWQTIVAPDSIQAVYIRHHSGRTFTEARTGDGLAVFTFEPKQRCFAEHHTRPALFLVRGGDWRADTGLIRAHQGFTDWQEDFGEHQARIADQQMRG